MHQEHPQAGEPERQHPAPHIEAEDDELAGELAAEVDEEEIANASFSSTLNEASRDPRESILDHQLPVHLDDAAMASYWQSYQGTLRGLLLRMGSENSIRETILRTPNITSLEDIYSRLALLPKLGRAALVNFEQSGLSEIATRIAGECSLMEMGAAAGYRTFALPALVEGLIKSGKMRDRSIHRMYDTFDFLSAMMQLPMDDQTSVQHIERTGKLHRRYEVAGDATKEERDLFKYIALNMFYIGPAMRGDLTPEERRALCGLTVLVSKRMGHTIEATTRELEEFIPLYEAETMFSPDDPSELHRQAIEIAQASSRGLKKIPTISADRIESFVPERIRRILRIAEFRYEPLASANPTDLESGPQSVASARSVGSAAFPELKASLSPASAERMDTALERLKINQTKWAGLDVHSRIEILDRLTARLRSEARDWISSALAAKGIDPESPRAGEEWLAGPAPFARNIRLLKQTLQDVAAGRKPELPGTPYCLPSGQVAAPVFPTGIYDRLLFRGFSAEIWMKPGVSLEKLPDTMACNYPPKSDQGKVSLVLGAGNVSSIGPMDALYKLFVENKSVILKMNPVNEYLGKHFERVFKELIDFGAMEIVYGGAKEGSYLCHHPKVDEIHITGSDKTHDAIVFGGGDAGAQRKAARQPLLEKPISSELGNVSPVIVVPGPWSKSDLNFQGENIASMLTNNAGFNCNATRVIITDRNWSEREALLKAVHSNLEKAPPRDAYYPGARERFDSFAQAHPEALAIGAPAAAGKLPWLLIPGLDPENKDEMCYSTEAFCSVTGEVGIESKSIVEYIDRAVEFANNRVWGSLNASILVHPKSLKDPAVAEAVERAIANLKFGTVAVNHWGALGYALVSPTWGAFPGHDNYDIRSGRGVVHNTYMFEEPEKTVLRGPFTTFPKPAWFLTNATAAELGEKIFEFECNPSVTKLPGLMWSALRG